MSPAVPSAPPERERTFLDELDSRLPLPQERDPARRVQPGEVEIDSNWSVDTGNAQVAVASAQAYLVRLLREALDVPVQENAPAARPRIQAQVDPNRPAGHRIAVMPRGIEVVGSSAAETAAGLYALGNWMRYAQAPVLELGETERRPRFEERVLRAVHAPYYLDELADDVDYYTDGYLATLARHGLSAVWVHGYLQAWVPSERFPEFGQDSARRLAKLSALVERAARYGIKVFVYFCEPKALPADSPVFDRLPDVKGNRARGNPMDSAEQVASLCTSTPEVQAYLRESVQHLFRTAKGLGGLILITASENHSHCCSHGPTNCPRCAQREPFAVAAEYITLMDEAVRSVAPDAMVVAWTWSWAALGPDPQAELIERLPETVRIMPDWERKTPIERAGVKSILDEYAYSVLGPSPRYQEQAAIARRSAHPLWSRTQFCTTHELVTVPYYPVPARLAQKLERMAEQGVSGIMGCWIFGNYPGLMTELVGALSWSGGPDRDAVLQGLAASRFGLAGAAAARSAWKHFGEAFEHYPYSTPLLYNGPMNRAPAHPFWLEPRGIPLPPSWRYHPPGDKVGPEWLRPYALDAVIAGFTDFLAEWQRGLEDLDAALAAAPPYKRPTAEREAGVAKAIACHFASTVNLLRFWRARDALFAWLNGEAGGESDERQVESGEQRVESGGRQLESGQRHAEPGGRTGTPVGHGGSTVNPVGPAEPAPMAELLAELERCVQAEIANCRAFLPIVQADSRIGFHSEVEGYWYVPEEIERKLADLERTLAVELPALAERVRQHAAGAGSTGGSTPGNARTQGGSGGGASSDGDRAGGTGGGTSSDGQLPGGTAS